MPNVNRRKITLAVLSAGMFLGSVALAEDAWIKSEIVQIRSGKGPVYPVIASAKKGDKLNVIAHEGKWLKIKLNDQDGYVYEDAISSEKVGGGGNLLANLGAGGDSTDLTSGNAAKGLNPEAETYAKGKNLDPKVLDKVIAANKKIDPKEWEAFTAEGKVGPNAP